MCKSMRQNLTMIMNCLRWTNTSIICSFAIVPTIPSLTHTSLQRCFPLNKGEEWRMPEYTEEPRVIFSLVNVVPTR